MLSEFNAYLKQIKEILSAVKKVDFYSLVTKFSLQQTEAVSTILGLISSEKIWNPAFLSDITLRSYARQIRILTSHFEVADLALL